MITISVFFKCNRSYFKSSIMIDPSNYNLFRLPKWIHDQKNM